MGDTPSKDLSRYVVLTSTNNGMSWQEGGEFPARSKRQALQEYAATQVKEEGGAVGGTGLIAVAIPAKSFRPTTIRVETVQKVSLSDGIEAQPALA